jgi:pimeloyl-ACP methyl ester carboxylesterase
MSNSDPEIGKSILAAGVKTNYLEAGEGEPVILIHGSGPGVTAYANWRLTIPQLAQKYRVLAPDIAGFGYTERKPGQVYDLDFWVRHLTEWMDAVGVKKRASLATPLAVR